MKGIAICSSKGGIGKSTIGVNLALWLSRNTTQKVVVVMDDYGSFSDELVKKYYGDFVEVVKVVKIGDFLAKQSKKSDTNLYICDMAGYSYQDMNNMQSTLNLVNHVYFVADNDDQSIVNLKHGLLKALNLKSIRSYSILANRVGLKGTKYCKNQFLKDQERFSREFDQIDIQFIKQTIMLTKCFSGFDYLSWTHTPLQIKNNKEALAQFTAICESTKKHLNNKGF